LAAAGGLDPEYIRELFAAFGPVTIRRMFGGAGLYVDGRMFGLVDGGIIYLKAKTDTIAAFEREGCQPFGYATKAGRRVLPSYWRLPDRLYDDPDELAQWARAARATALQSAAAKLSAPKRHTPRPKVSIRKAPP